MRSIVIFRFFSHLSLLFVYQCITFLPLIFRFSLYICLTVKYTIHTVYKLKVLFVLIKFMLLFQTETL